MYIETYVCARINSMCNDFLLHGFSGVVQKLKVRIVNYKPPSSLISKNIILHPYDFLQAHGS